MNLYGTVSVLVAAYNALETIDRAIDSVFAQTYKQWQLVIVDDASSDGTVEAIERRRVGNEDRIILVCCQENGGPAKARNAGLMVCTGEWVAVLDTDDAWKDNRLALLLDHATRLSADAACDNLLGFDDHLRQETNPIFGELPGTLDIEAAVAAQYGGSSYNLGYLKPIMRNSFTKDHCIRYDERLRSGEDLLYLLSMIVCGGKVICVDQPTYIYTLPFRDSGGRLSQSTKTIPRDAEVSSSLSAFLQQNWPSLTVRERQAIDIRIKRIATNAPISEFHYARLGGNWSKLLSLVLTSQAVRRNIWKSIAKHIPTLGKRV
jgi:Glycosyl transferase family 2